MVYYLIAPLAWNFFLSYQNMSDSGVPIRLEAKMGEYLSLMMRFIFAFGIFVYRDEKINYLNRGVPIWLIIY